MVRIDQPRELPVAKFGNLGQCFTQPIHHFSDMGGDKIRAAYPAPGRFIIGTKSGRDPQRIVGNGIDINCEGADSRPKSLQIYSRVLGNTAQGIGVLQINARSPCSVAVQFLESQMAPIEQVSANTGHFLLPRMCANCT